MLKKVNILIAGGGTGGHLFPAFAIGSKLEKEGAIITYIGSKHGIEKKYEKNLNNKIYLLNIKVISRNLSFKSLLQNILFPIRFITSYLESIIIIKNLNPKLIIGTGGYSSGLPILAGRFLNIPYVLHEQNSYPGITTKYLSKNASKIFISYNSIKDIINNKNYLLTGNPIRENLKQMKRDIACKKIGFNANKKIIFILGGSQGSKPLNSFFIKNYKKIIEKNIQIIWQTGVNEFEKINNSINDNNVLIKSFIKDMSIPYSCSDIVISRAGALAIEELKSFSKPMILIPYPNSAGNHQRLNALKLVESNAAKLVQQNDMENKLINIINELLNDTIKMKEIGDNAKKLHNPNSLDLIIDEIKEIINV